MGCASVGISFVVSVSPARSGDGSASATTGTAPPSTPRPGGMGMKRNVVVSPIIDSGGRLLMVPVWGFHHSGVAVAASGKMINEKSSTGWGV